jgi:5S rRNA maturation endonuclease (ribonuclease M5)
MKERIKNHFSGNYQQFYSKYLQKVKKGGGSEFKALCPFHDDSTPSFCFNNDTGQYFCQGCAKKGDAFHFYAKLNSLNTRSDFNKILRGIADDFGIPWQQQKRRIVKTYDYLDGGGQLQFQVVRYDPKDFRQRRPDGNGGWHWNLKGIDPVIYNLPQVLKASEVCIVEGEKDADNLATLGICATTCAMGAKKWRDHYNQYLKGKQVVLIPDNDNEGREHIAQIGNALNGNAASLKLLEIPDLPSKGDISDFIDRFKGDKEAAAERIAVMIENAAPYEPPKTYSYEDVFIDIADFRSIEIAQREAYLAPWLKQESINMIYGWRGVGKSLFALSILDSVSRGEHFGFWKCEKSTPCAFIDGEMTISDNQERIDDLKLLQGERKSPLIIYSDHYANQLGLPRANLINETWRNKVKSFLIANKIMLVVIDNLASLAAGIDENKKHEYDPINQWLLNLRFAGISTILLHHESKEGKQRGTAAREDNLDISIRLKKPRDYFSEDGARFIVHFSKSRVRTKDLNLIADTEFKLDQDENGQTAWTYKNVKAESRVEVLKLLDEGLTQKDIATELNIDKGYVSRIKKQAIADGHLTTKNKLTQSGFLYVCEQQI